MGIINTLREQDEQASFNRRKRWNEEQSAHAEVIRDLERQIKEQVKKIHLAIALCQLEYIYTPEKENDDV